MDVLIPMAGRGERFRGAGFKEAKPFISVNGLPMIVRVMQNLDHPGIDRFILITLREHQDTLQNVLLEYDMWERTEVVAIPAVTEGAAMTCLAAGELVSDAPLVIANSDQLVTSSLEAFYSGVPECDGLILTMTSQDPKWSYVELDGRYSGPFSGRVSRVVEKEVISHHATVGVYGYGSGRAFISYASEMIRAEMRSKNEFYVAPAYNLMIQDNLEVFSEDVGLEQGGMWGLGTPDDLAVYIEAHTA